MKKIIALLLAALLLVSLSACKAGQAEEKAEPSAAADPAPEAEAGVQAEAQTDNAEAQNADTQNEAVTAPAVVTPTELQGSWILSEENDPEKLEAVFPGAREYGGSMQLGMDGLMFWTIGTTGGAGSFTVDGDTLNGQIYLDYNGAAQDMTCTVDRSATPIKLTMRIDGADVIWVLE